MRKFNPSVLYIIDLDYPFASSVLHWLAQTIVIMEVSMELFGFRKFDELLAFHCSPVLMRVKPANMIALPQANTETIMELIQEYNKQFASEGIIFRRLCCCSKRCLLLIYNEKELRLLLQDKGCRAYLTAAGYSIGNSLEDDLLTLEQRLQQDCNFPHEIGLFLGYPLEDVLGFVLNKGSNCKYSGYWKVYGDVEQARKLFNTYEKCRDFVLQRLTEGLPLYNAVTIG